MRLNTCVNARGRTSNRMAIVKATRRDVVIAISSAAVITAQEAKADECVVVPNGLKYCETKVGEGPEPVPGSMIRAHYTGRLVSNGRVFDSSYERGRPLQFKIGAGEVIRGWDLGILGSKSDGVPPMKEGGKRKLIIPSNLGYGSRGAGGGVIPPDADLEFDVELLPNRR
jgi:peptidylprolyl isomerase